MINEFLKDFERIIINQLIFYLFFESFIKYENLKILFIDVERNEKLLKFNSINDNEIDLFKIEKLIHDSLF